MTTGKTKTVSVRLPVDLAEALQSLAHRQYRSLNAEIVRRLRESMAAAVDMADSNVIALLVDALKVAQVRIFLLEGASDAYLKIDKLLDEIEPRRDREKERD